MKCNALQIQTQAISHFKQKLRYDSIFLQPFSLTLHSCHVMLIKGKVN